MHAFRHDMHLIILWRKKIAQAPSEKKTVSLSSLSLSTYLSFVPIFCSWFIFFYHKDNRVRTICCARFFSDLRYQRIRHELPDRNSLLEYLDHGPSNSARRMFNIKMLDGKDVCMHVRLPITPLWLCPRKGTASTGPRGEVFQRCPIFPTAWANLARDTTLAVMQPTLL